MTTYDYKYLISRFNELFPTLVSKYNVPTYKTSSKQPNTLQIIFEHSGGQKLIFVYNDRHNFKLMSEECFNEEEDAILKLRTELTKVQKTLRDERRKKNI